MSNDKTRFGKQMPEMTILSDNPRGAQGDHYNLESRMGAVLDIVRHANTQCPLAVAVTGDWGTGKTSAMRWLQDQLRAWNKLGKNTKARKFLSDTGVIYHPRVYPVWFEPWKYTSREDVWRGIISEVILACTKVENLDTENAAKRLWTAGKHFGAFLGRGFVSALSKASLKIGDAKTTGELSLKGEFVKDIVEDFKSTTHPEKAYLNDFEETLKKWIQSSLNGEERSSNPEHKTVSKTSPQRICIFIDDLDRCLPEVTMEVLEALKLYLNIDQLIFVVGLDREVVDAVVTKHYKEHGVTEVKAQSYLDKMFQVEVDITPGNQKVEDNYSKLLGALNDSCGDFWNNQIPDEYRDRINNSLREVARGNPREVKRLLNGALLRGYAAHHDNKLRDEEELDEKLLFTQGVQMFLLQRYLRFTLHSTSLNDDGVCQWFEKLSLLLENCPNYKPQLSKPSKGEGSIEADSTDSSDTERNDEEKLIDTHLESRPVVDIAGKRTRLELATYFKHLWELLSIPFKVKVANAIPIKTSSSTSTSSQPDISEIHPEILNYLASNLEKSAEDITLNDILQCSSLDLSDTEITDKEIPFISSLPKLEELHMVNTQVSDINALAECASLQHLDLDGTQVENVNALAQCENLQILDIRSTQVSDVSALAGSASLQVLYLSNTQVSDVSALANSASLQMLYLSNTQVNDVSALAESASLQVLYLSNTQVSDVSALANSASLQRLYLGNTQVNDVSALAESASLQRLDLDNTQVNDVSALAGSASLQELDLRNTQVSDVSALAGSASLQRLDLSKTQVNDVSALAGSASLQRLNLNNTQVGDVSALAGSASLQELDLSNTQVSDLSALANAKQLQTLYLEKGSTLDTSMLKCSVAKF